MKINTLNNYDNNFKGGFRFKEPSPFMKTKLEDLTKRGCKVFYNFEKTGDTFLLAPDTMNRELEYDFKKVFSKHFKYYPNLTPELFDTPKLLKKVLQFAKLPAMYDKIKSRTNDTPLSAKIETIKHIGYEVDTDNVMVKMYKGVTKINDLTNKRQFIISPSVKAQTHIKVLPHDGNKEIEYFIVDDYLRAGIVQNSPTPETILEFTKNFADKRRNYDSEFLKNSNFARTNLELLAEYAWNPEEFFEHATKEVPELTKSLCSDDLFVPDYTAFKLIFSTKKEQQKVAFEKYRNFQKNPRVYASI